MRPNISSYHHRIEGEIGRIGIGRGECKSKYHGEKKGKRIISNDWSERGKMFVCVENNATMVDGVYCLWSKGRRWG